MVSALVSPAVPSASGTRSAREPPLQPPETRTLARRENESGRPRPECGLARPAGSLGGHAANEESGKLEAGLGSRAKVRVLTDALAASGLSQTCSGDFVWTHWSAVRDFPSVRKTPSLHSFFSSLIYPQYQLCTCNVPSTQILRGGEFKRVLGVLPWRPYRTLGKYAKKSLLLNDINKLIVATSREGAVELVMFELD